MTSRSLTESYNFLRNNAFQNRSFFADQKSDDRARLVPKSQENDVEKGHSFHFPTEWQNQVNTVQYTFTVIRQKMTVLIALHNRHLVATNMDDNIDEDQEIEHQTKELTEIFSLSHRQLSQLSTINRSSVLWHAPQAHKLSKNVLSSLARTLQDLSVIFRKAQSEYLEKLKSRDERIRGYLSMGPILDTRDHSLDDFGDSEYQQWEAQKQKRGLLLEENTTMVTQREQEINEIVRSIHELNEIFRDVAQLVVDQGTLVDRIDYNVEHTQIRVEHGLQELTKAQKHQAKDRKMVIILILASLVVIFGVLLIVTKFR